MSKHTYALGPWEIDRFGTLRDAGGDRILIAGASLSCGDDPEAEPNARLIAAAPDMRKACDAVLEWWAEHQYDCFGVSDGEYVDDVYVYDSEPEMVTLARAAIAKAEGGQDE